ncbi:hypothetical protein PR202_gb06965 [Eleusine coracana subsp. coracana]|uniref:NAC domain-containing protein n=1 Tax=Eleusine coracana subsp. coracana TaxID=191504 RepID=A0AAV5EB04_ELECO|nr:hypothetical protein QOZ80_2BG0164190 [Eleusine coracana subsp. coracana]KAK3152839.1 hypothetical protein QOZ80_2BG0164210 [Eleusine coracana subsp. coracana]GJN19665.1 hypothetical protein PR202_gb06965 [Eleusine coracana subsp. coracana]
MSMAARALGLPPGVTFRPEPSELVELYLLPRAWGQSSAISGVVIEDEGTSSTVPPWELLARHGRAEDDEAYFFERVRENEGEHRACGSNWSWISQRKTKDKVLHVHLPGSDDKRVTWNKRDLNLHLGKGRSGSTGWVMHEYKIISPSSTFLPVKICHVAFTGHGQKRKRVPDELNTQEPQQQRQSKRAAVALSSPSQGSTTTFVGQEQEFHLPPLGQDQEQERFLNQHTHGFNQEQLHSYEEEGSSVLTCQETCPGERSFEQNKAQCDLQPKFCTSYEIPFLSHISCFAFHEKSMRNVM